MRSDLITPTCPTESIPRLALSSRELSESLGCSERTVSDWVKQGIGPPSFVQGRLRFFPIDTTRQWLAEQSRQATGADSEATE